MRKTIVICDRCGAEIDGKPAGLEIVDRSMDELNFIRAKTEDVADLFTTIEEQGKAVECLNWDFCGECVAQILRTAMRKSGAEKALVKNMNLPDAPKATRGRKIKSSDADEMERDRSDRIEKKRRTER